MERATSAACRRFMGRAADATFLTPVIEWFVASP
jgi:hypothetical protein